MDRRQQGTQRRGQQPGRPASHLRTAPGDPDQQQPEEQHVVQPHGRQRRVDQRGGQAEHEMRQRGPLDRGRTQLLPQGSQTAVAQAGNVLVDEIHLVGSVGQLQAALVSDDVDRVARQMCQPYQGQHHHHSTAGGDPLLQPAHSAQYPR
jgi:hypothetical protein